MANETPEQMAARLEQVRVWFITERWEPDAEACAAGAAALRAALSREDREQALDLAVRWARGFTELPWSDVRRAFKLDPTPTEDQ